MNYAKSKNTYLRGSAVPKGGKFEVTPSAGSTGDGPITPKVKVFFQAYGETPYEADHYLVFNAPIDEFEVFAKELLEKCGRAREMAKQASTDLKKKF